MCGFLSPQHFIAIFDTKTLYMIASSSVSIAEWTTDLGTTQNQLRSLAAWHTQTGIEIELLIEVEVFDCK